jgi:hypothetical protein
LTTLLPLLALLALLLPALPSTGLNRHSGLAALAGLLPLLPPALPLLVSLPAALARAPGHGLFNNLVSVPFHIGQAHGYFNLLSAGVSHWFLLRLLLPGAAE